MKEKVYKTFSIRLEQSDYEKLRQIAQEEGRFLSQQAALMVRRGIRDFPLPETPQPQDKK